MDKKNANIKGIKDIDISIIITTYNSSSLITKTLDSIVNQTYKAYEVVIVDDGSVDNTIAVIENYIANNRLKNFKLIPLLHIGRGKALNCAVQLARYEWIAIIDSDDLWNRHKLSHQVDVIEKYNICCLATKTKIFTHDDSVNLADWISFQDKKNLRLVGYNSLLCRNSIAHCSVLIKKEFLRYDEERKSQFDYALWLKLMSNGVDIYILEEVLTYHRIHKNQSFESKCRFRYIVRTIKLQLGYCLKDKKIWAFFFVCLKPIYYIFVNRCFITFCSKFSRSCN